MDTGGRTLIVGGGIFGLGTAWALARAGFGRVAVLERHQLGSGATALAGGLVSAQTWNDLDADLIRTTRSRIEELVAWGSNHAEPAARTAWHAVGGLTVAGPAHHAYLDAIHRRSRRLGEPAEVLEASEAARKIPRLRFGRDERVLVGPRDGYVESTDLVELLRRQCRGLGVELREARDVSALWVEDGAARGVIDAGAGREPADRVVVAGGAWTAAFLARAGAPVPALAYRTQLAALEMPGAHELPVVHDGVHRFYARPESATRFLAGDGTELRPFDPDAFNPAPDAAFIESIARGVLARFRDGDAARYRTGWAGLCVGTPDRRPLAGPVPGLANLWVLTGDNGFGLMRGLALGELLAAAIAGRRPPQAAACDPARFGAEPPTDFPLSEGFSFPPEEAPATTLRAKGKPVRP